LQEFFSAVGITEEQAMGDVSITLDQLASRDTGIAEDLEREVRAATAGTAARAGLACRILSSRPQAVSLQLSLPGWTKVLSVPLPAAPGAVREAVRAALVSRLGVAPTLGPGEETGLDLAAVGGPTLK
jgi:hypothetical protein